MMKWFSKIPEVLKSVFDTLCQAAPPKGRRWMLVVFLIGLYAAGFVWFGDFFNWGNYSLEFHDWAVITGPRYQFLKTAMMTSQMPYHISDPSTLHGWTLRFSAVSDTFFSPQMILLRWMQIPLFNLVNIWLTYSLGFIGLLYLRSRLRLSAIAFTPLFLLFNFNGHILAHLGVGHETWTGYFLFPWFVWLILRLLDGEHSWAVTLEMAALLFIMWLQGAFHQYIWALLLLAFIGICVPRTFWMVVRTGFFAIVISAFRVLPAILMFGNFSGSTIGGYPSLYALWDALVSTPNPVINSPFFVTSNLNGSALGNWELTCFIGMVGVTFLLYFGLYRGMIAGKAPYRLFAIPLVLIIFLAFGKDFDLLRSLPIPLLQGERVTSRMISVVLVFGLVFAAERFQRWIEENQAKPVLAPIILLGIGFMAAELWQNQIAWRLPVISKLFQKSFFDVQKAYVSNQYNDTIFLWLFWGGLAITLVTTVVLAWLAVRENRRLKQKRLEPQPASVM
jgi:hypothetical protein